MADTDITIIHLSNFHHIRALNNLAAEIWTSLKGGKTTKMISLNTITTNHYNVQSRDPFIGRPYSLDQTVFLHVQGKRFCCILMHSVICRHTVPIIYKAERTSFVCRLH